MKANVGYPNSTLPGTADQSHLPVPEVRRFADVICDSLEAQPVEGPTRLGPFGPL